MRSNAPRLGALVPGSYDDRLKEAEALAARARTAEERRAFDEIVAVWRRLVAANSASGKTARASLELDR